MKQGKIMDNMQNRTVIDDITIYTEEEQIKAADNNGKAVPFILCSGLDTGLWHNIMLLSPNSINCKP